MACRCDDIDKYTNDIRVLEEAATLAQQIIDYQITIDDTIDTLSEDYNYSIIPPNDLESSFVKIHDGAISNARAVKTQIEGVLRTARELLKAAVEEDNAFDHEEG